MQIKHLCVLIHIWTKGEVGAPLNRFKPTSKISLLTVPRRCFFYGPFLLFLSCFVMLACASVCWCLVVTCWERADLLALVTLSFPHWYPGSGVVLDCIDSWSLPSFLLSWRKTTWHYFTVNLMTFLIHCNIISHIWVWYHILRQN